MDWNAYKVVYLPKMAVLDKEVIAKIRKTLGNAQGTQVVADGRFGTNAGNGRFSYDPPEGLSELLEVKMLDCTRLTQRDIRQGANRLRLVAGHFEMKRECNHAGLLLSGKAQPIAWYGDEVVGMETENGRFTWITFSLWEAFESPVRDEVLLPLVRSLGIGAPVKTQGDRIIVQRARSRQGGWLLFLFNLQDQIVRVQLSPQWKFSTVRDLIARRALRVREQKISTHVPAGEVEVLYVS